MGKPLYCPGAYQLNDGFHEEPALSPDAPSAIMSLLAQPRFASRQVISACGHAGVRAGRDLAALHDAFTFRARFSSHLYCRIQKVSERIKKNGLDASPVTPVESRLTADER